MSPPDTRPPKRRYDNSRREAQARDTRRRVVAAASALFVERGYAATSVAAIADAADVSPQTVYAAFRTKAALLGEAVGVAMAGDDEPVAIFDRPEAQAVLAATDPTEAARAFAGAVTRLLERAGHLIHAADGAADHDPELHALRVSGHRMRLADMRRVARALGNAGLLRPGLDPELAADLLWAVASPDAYRAFVVIRGWTPARFERWLAQAVERALLVDPGQPAG
jgi:AcrR family transcriptional regulator